GIPPVAGFFGKFLLLKSVVEQGAVSHGYYCLVGVAIVGVVISIYYYFGVIRAIYWSEDAVSHTSIPVSCPMKFALISCMVGIIYLGVLPGGPLRFAEHSSLALSGAAGPAVHQHAAR